MHSLLAPAANLMYMAQGRDGINYQNEKKWEVKKFLDSSTSYMQTIGGSFLALLGVCGIVWGGFLLIRKLMGGQSAQQDSWFKIIMLIIIGGVFLFSGLTILLNFAAGAKDTINEFGTSTIVLSYLSMYL